VSRVLDRVGKVCQGCGVRLTIGEPAVRSAWAGELVLTEAQIKSLTEAAREFDILTRRSRMELDALDFIDWLSPSTRESYKPPTFDGAPRHNLNGEPSVMQHKGDTHRHPFPLPTQSDGARHTRGMRHR